MFKWRGVAAFAISFFLPPWAFADFSPRLELFGYSTTQFLKEESRVNENNLTLEIPQQTYFLELRPDIQWDLTDRHMLVIRSRHFIEQREADYYDTQEPHQVLLSYSDLTDAYWSAQIADDFSTTIGLQNYQWGPAEILSPSNVFFHFHNSQRSWFYKEKGRMLVRANWTPSSLWTIMLISEPLDNKTSHWVEGEDFYPQTALKIERQGTNPANHAAFVMGRTGEYGQYIGGHFAWALNDAVSLYSDAKGEFNTLFYHPLEVSPGTYIMNPPTPATGPRWTGLAVVGLRWEGRVDFRQEFVWNEAGYTKKMWQQALDSITTLSPYVVNNIKRFQKSGLELRSQAYSYTSLRIPDLGWSRSIHFSVRWLHSLVMNSSAVQMNYEHDWNDFLVLSLEATAFLGDDDTEFTLIEDGLVTAGFKISF